MATLKRTFINRGKRPFEQSELKPNGIYAVHHVIPAESAAEYGTTQEQWGIVVLNSIGVVRRSYNIEVRDGWHDGITDTTGMTFWKSSVLERQFAVADETVKSLIIKRNTMMGMISERDTLIRYYENNILHRIAEKICNILKL